MNPRISNLRPPRTLVLGGLLVFLLGLFLAWAPGTAMAKSYKVSQLYVEATVNPDGSMDVLERRTFSFDGSFSWVIQDLSLSGSDGITDIRVSEDGEDYLYAELGQNTYSYVQRGDKIEVTWRFDAQDTDKTFDISYKVSGAVVAHADIAELYWKFVGSEWEVAHEDVSVVLTLPAGASAGDLRAWGHGPLAGQVDIVSPEKVTWTVPRVPAGESLEGRIAFPKSLVPRATRTDGRTALPNILQEEEKWADEANRSRRSTIAVVGGSALAALASIVTAFMFQFRHGREFKPQFEGDYYRELPGDYTPAELGALWNFGSVGATEITATIMDLARRGYLTIEVTSRQDKVLGGLLGSRTSTEYRLKMADRTESVPQEDVLMPHEKAVWNFLFIDVANGADSLDFDQIRAFSKSSPQRAQGFLAGFRGNVTSSRTVHGFFDHRTERYRTIELVIGILLFFAGMAITMIFQNPFGMFITLGGAALFIGGLMLRRRSQTGSTHLAMWKAFRKFLQHFSSLDRAEVPSLVIWEHYLVYAITLGVAKEVIEQLKVVYPELNSPHPAGYYHGWAWMRMAGSGRATGDVIGNLTESLRSSVNTAMNYGPSSGGGRGGGFSGGGGGGGGAGR